MELSSNFKGKTTPQSLCEKQMFQDCNHPWASAGETIHPIKYETQTHAFDKYVSSNFGIGEKKFRESKKVHAKNYIAKLFTLQQELSPTTDLKFYFQYFNKISEEIIHSVCFLDRMDNIQYPIESDIETETLILLVSQY